MAKYDPRSMKAEEFINDEEIRATLEYAEANKNNVRLIDEILEKADLTEDYTAVKPVHAKLGPAFKADAKAIVAEIAKMDPKAVAAELAKNGKTKVTVNGNEIELNSEYLALEKRLMLGGKAVDTLQIDNVLVAIEM